MGVRVVLTRERWNALGDRGRDEYLRAKAGSNGKHMLIKEGIASYLLRKLRKLI